MLFAIEDLQGLSIHATDGNIGEVKNVYFDDEVWVVRYLVVATGRWLDRREVLVSPIAVGQPDWVKQELPVDITQQQVKDSPSTDTNKPLSRQQERDYLGYFGYPFYWGGLGFGAGIYPSQIIPSHQPSHPKKHEDEDTHLRSFEAVKNYQIMASDGDIGHVQGLIIEEDTWAIRYLVVNTSNWWIGKQVLVAAQWIKEVSWEGAQVTVNVTRQQVKDAPVYDGVAKLNRKTLQENYGFSSDTSPNRIYGVLCHNESHCQRAGFSGPYQRG